MITPPTARLVRAVGWVVAGVVLATAAGLWAHHRWDRIVVVSASMSPTIAAGDTAWVDRSVDGEDVAVGDVVVFHDPGGWTPDDALLTKRVLAVGGQHLICCGSDGRLERDGEAVAEPYLPDGARPSLLAFDVVVPAGHLWVMGDNRAHSLDSRQRALGGCAAFVPVSAVAGVVVGR